MQIVIALYDRFTALDAVGPHQVLAHVPGAEIIFASERARAVSDETGTLTLVADASYADVPAPDILLVPGGPGQSAQMGDTPLRDWITKADKTSMWTTSVCTGSLAMNELASLGAKPVHDRYVFDGKYATSAGVSAGIDMALALAARLTDDDTAQAIQLGIEYAPNPPFNAGSPATAPADLIAAQRAASRFP
jgi:putative intracellular protease/amidase